LWHYANI